MAKSFGTRPLPPTPHRQLVAKIPKAQRHAEVPAPAERDHFLQVVPLLPIHANLPLLEGALHLEIRSLDCLHDLLRLVAIEPLLDDEVLRRMAERRDDGVFPFDVAQIDVPLGELARHDVVEALQARAILRLQLDLRFLLAPLDRGLAAFEVEADRKSVV